MDVNLKGLDYKTIASSVPLITRCIQAGLCREILLHKVPSKCGTNSGRDLLKRKYHFFIRELGYMNFNNSLKGLVTKGTDL